MFIRIKNKKAFLIGIAFSLCGCVITWYMGSFPRPLGDPPWLIEMAWIVIHLPVYLLLTVFRPPIYLETFAVYLAVFIEWFIIGRLAFWIIRLARRKEQQ